MFLVAVCIYIYIVDNHICIMDYSRSNVLMIAVTVVYYGSPNDDLSTSLKFQLCDNDIRKTRWIGGSARVA